MGDRLDITSTRLDFDELHREQGYEYHRPAKWGWLSDLLWKGLSRLSAVRPHMVDYKVWRIERVQKAPELLKAIHPMIDEWLYRRNHGDEMVIVMGEIDFMEFVHSTEFRGPGDPFEIIAKPFGYRGQIFGVPVHVVQSISGVAMIPRVLVEGRQ